MSATSSKRSTEEKVIDALGATPEATVDQVAEAAAIGLTSARKYLAELASAGKVKRVVGGREAKRKLGDRYSLTTAKGPDRDDVKTRSEASTERLRPGGPDELVLGFVRDHQEEGPFGPTAVAKGLGRSSGAVGNSASLAGAKKILQVSEHPRRYEVLASRKAK